MQVLGKAAMNGNIIIKNCNFFAGNCLKINSKPLFFLFLVLFVIELV